jgi:hypothetical protein
VAEHEEPRDPEAVTDSACSSFGQFRLSILDFSDRGYLSAVTTYNEVFSFGGI